MSTAEVEYFAACLKMHAERLKLTQPKMAVLLAVSKRTLWQWMHAKVKVLQVTMEGAIDRLRKQSN